MNRIIVFALMFFCMTMQIEAQTLSEEEVTAKMYQAFELNKACLVRRRNRLRLINRHRVVHSHLLPCRNVPAFESARSGTPYLSH